MRVVGVPVVSGASLATDDSIRYDSRSGWRHPASDVHAGALALAREVSSPGAWVLLVFRIRMLTFAKIDNIKMIHDIHVDKQ